jgi:hypothetical protein
MQFAKLLVVGNNPSGNCIPEHTFVSGINQLAEVLVLGGEYIVARSQRGVCFAYNKLSRETLVIN